MNDVHYVQSVYALLARMGVDPHDIELSYELPKSDSYVALAIPKTKVGIAIEGDVLDGFDKDGWYIKRLTEGELETFSRVFQSLSISSFEHVRRTSQNGMTKKGSKEEERLLAAILKSNIPNPNRNYRIARENGSELTTPDFTWEALKVAFFMDGLWWHVGKDDLEKSKMLTEIGNDNAKRDVALETNRVRATKDANNRSELGAMGWIILSCTDEDLQDDAGVATQVDRISKTLRQRKREMGSKTVQQLDPLEDLNDIVI